MRFDVSIAGDWQQVTAAEVNAAEIGVTRGIAAGGQSLKKLWRGQVLAAGLGNRLANSVRSQLYPRAGYSLGAAALIYTNADKLMNAFDTGPTIISKEGYWLAIPQPSAGKGLRGGKITPGEWERRTGRRLVFIYRRGRTAFLMDSGIVRKHQYLDRKGFHKMRRQKKMIGPLAPVFILVPRVKLKKMLDIAAAAEQAASMVPSAIVANWGR